MRNVVEELAKEFLEWNTDSAGSNSKGFLVEVKNNLYEFSKNKDKSHYLKLIIKAVEVASTEHEKECRNPNTCPTSTGFTKSLFFLNQELQDIFHDENIEEFEIRQTLILNQKIDRIISGLENLKTDTETIQKGQLLIVEGFMEEFEELKTLYNLGQKNWRQNLFGKFSEMVASGIVSESISKEVIEIVKGFGKELPLLLTSKP
jgi:hypothetical protein